MTPPRIRSDLARLATANLSDALDKLGVHAAPLDLKPITSSMRMVGQAYTVRYVPMGAVKSSSGDWLDEVDAGQVAVIDNGGRTDCTVWGDIMTSVSASRGVAGTLIAGVCRDISRCIELNYPVFSMGHFMRTGKDRVQLADTQVPVSVGGVRVDPGDWVVGDADGVVVVANAVVEDAISVAQEIAQREEHIQQLAVETGRLREARERYGYHELQRRHG